MDSRFNYNMSYGVHFTYIITSECEFAAMTKVVSVDKAL